ncbi:sensor histidine kinase [Scytonema millei]|uniref:histidine kinase n=1 Tax=Scytonema millei VB511283 TaxID=1245923 RepID=A0A9X5E909_9CYAN|nr:ATP-binding protein [Scytonema millei]NHC37526.1 GAF domain-containing protein [Scytonema millei VB511283]
MSENLQLTDVEFSLWDEEPVQLINQIQPHGVIVVLEEPDLKILQVSTNTFSIFGIPPEELVLQTLADLLDPYQIERIKLGLAEENFDLLNPIKIWLRVKGDDYVVFDGIFHRNRDKLLILELEPALTQENIPFLSFYHLARASINRLATTTKLQDFGQVIVQEVHKVTGFDRVMLYKFDNDGHGVVIAEEKLDDMEAYLGLHFPESDIPKPARKLFCSNWIRIIPNAHAKPVELFPLINPTNLRPLDLTHSTLRSASACHLKYLHNMEVGASLTISLIKEDKLWGLIACHHRSPKYVSYELRKACEFLGRMIFAEISAIEETDDYDYNLHITHVRSQLVEYMSQAENWIDGLVKQEPNLLELVDAQGAAIYFNSEWTAIGQVPKQEHLNVIVQWLKHQFRDEEVFYTDTLPLVFPEAEIYKHVASGLLAIPIADKSYIIWFRPEVIQTVNWGGNPHEAYEFGQENDSVYLSPRKSFQLWKETVQGKSLPWKKVEIKAAIDLRKATIEVVLRQAEELSQIAYDLERSNAELKKFAYVASHDLQEPLNQVANYVQLLEMRYQEQLDEDAREFISYAVSGVSLMQTLIDDVLAYSKVDRQNVEFQPVDLEVALKRALSGLQGKISETGATISYDPLPTVLADSTQMLQLFQNLIGNAIKFRRDKPPVIHIGVSPLEDAWLFSVKDNGIGIDPQFSDRIFVIFQRLHTRDEYSGTGMGLAICKKVVECHRGDIWVASELGQGATFYFTIPAGGKKYEYRHGRKTQNHFPSGR